MKLFDLAAQTGAECALSDGDIEISGAAGLDQAQSGEVTFLSNPKYTNKIATTRAAAIYVAEDLEILRPDIAILRAKDPYLAFTRALIVFHPQPSFEAGIDPAAVVELTSKIGEGSFIGARSVIGRNVKIGDHVRILFRVVGRHLARARRRWRAPAPESGKVICERGSDGR